MTFAPLVEMNDGRSIPVIGFGVWQVPDDVVVGGDFLWTRSRRYPVFSAPWYSSGAVPPNSELASA